MSTVERKQVRSSPRASEAAPSPAPTPVRKRRWLPLAITVGIATLLVAAGPTLVVHTPLRNLALARLSSDVRGSVTCGNISCGWFAPLTATDVVIQDAAGRPLAALPAVQSDKGLLGLLLGGKNLGNIRLERPRIELFLREDGSNVEQVFASWLSTSPDTDHDRIGANVEIIDAALIIHDESSHERCEINQVALALKMPSSRKAPLELTFSGAVHCGDESAPASIEFSNQQVVTADGPPTYVGQLVLKAEQVPLAICQAALCRFAPASKAAGMLRADVDCQWGLNDSGQVRCVAVGQLAARQLVLAGPWLGSDPLHLSAADMPCQALWEADRLDIKRLGVKCDLGEVNCRGTLAEAKRLLNSKSLSDVLALVQGSSVETVGQLDLAKLAAALPKTMRMRADTQLTSGQIKWHASSRASGADMAWQGRLETSRLVAMHQGRELSWDNPLAVHVTAHHNGRGPVIDRLQCESDFIDLKGSGSANAFELSGTLDLSRLNAELSKFVDLGDLRLAGQGSTKLTWQRNSAASTFEATAQLQVADFALGAPDKHGWSETQLVMTATAAGAIKPDDTFPRRVDTAAFGISAASDRLEATLTQPVESPGLLTTWPVQIQLQGDAAHWLQRLTPWLGASDGWDIQGQTDLTATATVSALMIDFANSQLVIKPLAVRGHGLSIDEPEGRLQASARWLPGQRKLELTHAVLTAGNLTADVSDGKLDWSKLPAATSGKVSFRGDVAELARWLNEASAQPTSEFTGAVKGEVVVQQVDDQTTGQLSATIEDLLVTPRKGRQWREPTVSLTAAVNYNRATDAATLTQLELNSDVLKLQASGKLEKATTERQLQLNGKMDYDLDKVSRLVQPIVTVGVQLAGRESRSFSLNGPLVAAASTARADDPAPMLPFRGELLSGNLEFGWQWARFFGFDYGRATFQGELERGVFRLIPVDLPVSQGRVHLAGEAHLAPGPAEWRMATGKLVDHVEVTHQMSNQWLMLFAPALAGTTQAQGKFSVTIDNGRFPLANPLAGDVSGRLTLHTVEVSAGPLAQELSSLFAAPAGFRLPPESEVQFRLVQGRIYHRNLQLVFPELTIRTHGSVGFDESLTLVAEMTVPPKWLGNHPLAPTLKNQVIQLPISGTLHEPKIDQAALEQAAAQVVRDATSAAIQHDGVRVLNQQLDRFLGPATLPAEK